MSVTVGQLLNSALMLSIHDRVDLAEAILASIQPAEHPQVSEATRTEIERRSAELQSNPAIAISRTELWKQVNASNG